MAGFVKLLTTIDAETASATSVLSWYRVRWQIERAFRRMNHVARIDHLQTSRKTAVMALLGAALLVSALAERVHHELAREDRDHEGQL